MKRKILSSLFALVLLTGLSLVTAVPAAADGPPPPPPQLAGISLEEGWFTGATDNGTALWSTTQVHTGNYSAELTTTHNLALPAAKVAYGGTLTAFSTIGRENMTFWMYWDTLITTPYAIIYLDTDADGVADVVLMDRGPAEGTIPLAEDTWCDTLPHYLNDWHVCDYNAATGEVGLTGELCDGTTYSISDFKTLATWAALPCTGGGTFGDAEVLYVGVMFGGLGHQTGTCIAYVDDIIIDGVTYILEPMVLSAEWCKTGGTLGVAVLNSNASGTTPAIFAKSDTVGEGGAITVALSETGTGTGVFTGGFQLVNTTPGPGQLLVNEGDSVDVTYTGDWGAGSQPLGWADPPSATVDDTKPTIAIVSPAVSANITDNKTAIAASYSDVAIDIKSVKITVDSADVTKKATVDSSSVTYTPPEPGLDDGSHDVTVDVKDLAGNAAKTKSWSFTVDNVDPVITDAAATPPTMLPAVKTEVTFSANVTDAGSGIALVEIYDTLWSGSLEMLDEDADGIYTVAANITASEADYDLTIKATDEAGNEKVATGAITLVVSPDIVSPVITDPTTITYPFELSSARPGDEVTISANVTDNVLMGTVKAACTTAFETSPVSLTKGVGDIWTGTAKVKDGAAKGDYPITITAEDAKGNKATDKTLTLTVRSGATGVEIDLVEGWNLISLPLIPDSSNIMVVISADTLASENVSNVGIVYSYDPATGLFEYYMPATGSGDLTTMEDGYGYWVFMNADDTLAITGAQWPVPPAVPPVYPVVVGWNLIGFKSLVDLADTDYLISLHFYEDYDPYPVLWSYNAVAGAYENVKGVPNGMEVGHGFWLWMTETMVIVPPE